MGFRSSFCSDDYMAWPWPEWFRAKYQESVNVPKFGQLTSKNECKLYGQWGELVEDIQKAIDWSHVRDRPGARPFAFIVVFLHNCGGVTRFAITKDPIVCTEPTGWEVTDCDSHGDGCSYDCKSIAQDWRAERQ